MTFLNPLALFALAAAAIPLIVHLFNFRRPRRVDFSSLVFLREMERTTMQRVRIRQWLLLLLRTLAIAALVLAFSRPTLSGRLAGVVGDAGSTALAVVVDNSLSMSVTERSGERFRTARDAAIRLINEARPGDELYVISTADGQLNEQPLRPSSATEIVAGLELRPYSRPISAAIRDAARAAERSPHLAKEIFVISDMQASTLVDTVAGADVSGIRLSLIPVGERVPANVALTQVEVVSRIIDVGQPVRIEATLRNFAPDAFSDALVSVYLDDERVAQQVADIPASGAATVSFVVTPRDRGWKEGRIVLEDDGFPADNERYFTLYVPERRRVLIVRGERASTRHLDLALSPEVAEGRVVFDRETVAASGLSARSLGSYDAVVLGGVESLSSGEVDALARYVSEGGGLLMYPGRGNSVDAYNELLRRLGGGRFEGLSGTPGSGSPLSSLDRIDAEHPLFEGIFDRPVTPRLEPADVYAAARYAPAGASEHTLITMSNGWPLLQEIRHGAGVTFLMASALEPDWTDLAVRGLFVPLMYRAMFYLAAAEVDMGEGILLTEIATVRLPDRSGASAVRAITPEGAELAPEQRAVFGSQRITLVGSTLGQPGFADLVDEESGRLRQKVAVNLDPGASDLRLFGGDAAAERLADELGVEARVIPPGEDLSGLTRTLSEARYGVEIWNVFLLLALGFLVAEMLVARRWKPETVPA